MASFFTEKESFKNLFNVPHIDKQEGVYYVYATDEEAIKKILPKELTLVAPVVVGYLVNIEKPNFGGRYMEFALGIPCSFGEITGLYPLSLLLEGPGAFDGTTLGREFDGIPKKYAEKISFSKEGNSVSATIIRKGVKLFELKMEIGEYNDEIAGNFFAPEGATFPSSTFLYTYNTTQTENGNCVFSDGKLNNLVMETKNEVWKPATAEIKTFSSVDDPYGELPIYKVLGGAYIKHDTVIMEKLEKLADVDATETAQYLFAGRYDSCQITK